MKMVLTDGQAQAHREIMHAYEPGKWHLLLGSAGTGKTTLLQETMRSMQQRGLTVAASAPTHKAVKVIERKMREVGLEMPVSTCHKLLSLEPNKTQPGEGLQFRRRRGATPVDVDVVAIDEASMLGADVMRHARSQLANKFVLLIGDQAQLPPVNEEESQAFQIRGRSELTEIMRQAADNPIIKAATIVRHSQGGAVDWTWCRENRSDRAGVFVPEAHRVDAWLKKAFTHPEFEADPDSFRYLAWTNRKVASINAKVRRWRYGMAADEAPFVIGEKALVRAPIIHDDAIVAQTGEEIAVLAIEQANFYHALKDHGPCPSWLAEVPSWLITGKRDNGEIIRIHMIRNRSAYEAARNRILAEAIDDRDRWGERRDFDSALADLQPIYAMTVHASQGSTFGTVFVDVRDIKGRMDDNLLEMQQLLYVALTRPSTGAVLIGAPT